MYIDNQIHTTIGYYLINFAEQPCYLPLSYFVDPNSSTENHFLPLTPWGKLFGKQTPKLENNITYTRLKHKKIENQNIT